MIRKNAPAKNAPAAGDAAADPVHGAAPTGAAGSVAQDASKGFETEHRSPPSRPVSAPPPGSVTPPPDAPGSVTPEAALDRLLAGNARWVEDRLTLTDDAVARSVALQTSQAPFATIIGCADSRVAPELVFDQGPGSLFPVRIAGGVLAPEVLGSVEFAVAELQTRLVVVLGHERCGAVTATVDAIQANRGLPGHLDALRKAIEPAVREIALASKGHEALDAAIAANVRAQVAALARSGEIMGRAVAEGRVRVVGAVYSLRTRRVEILEDGVADARVFDDSG